MDEKEKKLREDLEFHLDTLRRNLEVVSMEDLKTKYANPFKELKDNICKTATAYTQYISLGGIRVKSRYGDEAVKYINEAIKDTPYLKKISEAAFERQDMDEIAALARQLREVVLQSLHVFSLPLFCLYVPTECMNDYHTPPEIYNDVTSQVLRNGEWQLAENIRPGELIPVQFIFEVSAPSEEAARLTVICGRRRPVPWFSKIWNAYPPNCSGESIKRPPQGKLTLKPPCSTTARRKFRMLTAGSSSLRHSIMPI